MLQTSHSAVPYRIRLKPTCLGKDWTNDLLQVLIEHVYILRFFPRYNCTSRAPTEPCKKGESLYHQSEVALCSFLHQPHLLLTHHLGKQTALS